MASPQLWRHGAAAVKTVARVRVRGGAPRAAVATPQPCRRCAVCSTAATCSSCKQQRAAAQQGTIKAKLPREYTQPFTQPYGQWPGWETSKWASLPGQKHKAWRGNTPIHTFHTLFSIPPAIWLQVLETRRETFAGRFCAHFCTFGFQPPLGGKGGHQHLHQTEPHRTAPHRTALHRALFFF